MTEGLKVAFRLLDQVSPALAQIDRGLVGTVRNLRDVDQALRRVGRAEMRSTFDRQTDPLLKYKAALRLVRDEMAGTPAAPVGAMLGGPWALAAGAVTAATTAVVAGGIALTGFAIKWAAFKRDNLLAFELITGGADRARVAYERLSRLADKTPFPTEDIVTFGKELLSAQFTLKETEDILAGVADAASVQGGSGAEAARSLLNGIAKIKGRDALNMETLEQVITGGGAAGVNLGNILETLAKERGTTVAAVRSAITASQVKGIEGIRAILLTVQRVTDKGGPLGTATRIFGTQSLGGQLSTLQSRVRGIFSDIDIGPLVGALTRVNDLLSAEGPTGRRIREFASTLFGKAFQWLGDKATEENLTALLQAISEGLGQVEDVLVGVGRLGDAFLGGLFQGLRGVPGVAGMAHGALAELVALVSSQTAEDWRAFGEAIGEVTRALAAIVKVAVPALEVTLGVRSIFGSAAAPEPSHRRINKAALDFDTGRVLDATLMGKSTAAGFAAGIASALSPVTSAASGLGNAAAAGVRDTLQIRSPSKVMENLGLMTGEGFATGVRRSDVSAELTDLVASSPGADADRARTARTEVRVTIGDIIVTSSGGASPGATGRDVADHVRRELVLALEELALVG